MLGGSATPLTPFTGDTMFAAHTSGTVLNTATLPAKRVAVVGGGWAGLSAAVRAASDGHHVTVFEASRHWGGRARAVPVTLPDGRTVALDNGQHILIGAYTDTLRLMQTVGVNVDAALLRVPLALVYPDGSGLRLPSWAMPTGMATATGIPTSVTTTATGTATAGQTSGAGLTAWLSHKLALPVVAGVCQARGWPWRDKLALLATATRWQLSGFKCDATATVAQLCARLPATLVAGFIDPLCVSALNTPADRASGQVFLRVLKDALFGVPGGADLLLPRVNLGDLFPHAAAHWLAAPERGADLRLGTRVTALTPCVRQPTAQASGDGTLCPAAPANTPVPGMAGWLVNGELFDRVVLANSSSKQDYSLISHSMYAMHSECTAKLQTTITTDACAEPTAPESWVTASNGLAFEAIATVYAWCERPDGSTTDHVLPQPMTALHHTPNQPAQFVFDRSWLDGPKGLLAFVVSASQADAHTLQTQVCAQAKAQLGLAVTPLKTIVEKRATFACTPGLHRPPAHIAANLVAAGDHIAGPYPATLEGAVRSGWYAGGVNGSH